MVMLGVGVISLGGAPLSLPSFVTPQFQEFFRLGRVLRTTLPTSQGGVVHLFFVVYGYQGAEEDAEKLRLTDHILPRNTTVLWASCRPSGSPLLPTCSVACRSHRCDWPVFSTFA